MRLAGIDLAWKSNRNTTAVAIGDLEGNSLRICRIEKKLSVEELKALIREEDSLAGVAVDAPLIITNEHDQRPCGTASQEAPSLSITSLTEPRIAAVPGCSARTMLTSSL